MTYLGRIALFACLLLASCDGQQYVSPDTLELSISSDATGSELVNHCDYVPVLLGAQVDANFVVDSSLTATLSITRQSVKVAFEGAALGTSPFTLTAAAAQESEHLAPDPPPGYSVKLSPGCTPTE